MRKYSLGIKFTFSQKNQNFQKIVFSVHVKIFVLTHLNGKRQMQINGSFANSNWKHHDSIKNLWYHVLKFLKKALFTAFWLSGVNLDSSLVTQYSLKFYVSFSFFIVLLFLHCGSCFLFVWAGMLQTAIVWCFFDV